MGKETRRLSRQADFEDGEAGSSRSGGTMLHLTEDLIPKFTGQDKTYPVTRWIEDVEDNAEVFSWSPVQQLLMARRSLSGTAALWLRSEKTFKSWEELKAAISKEFPDTVDIKTIHELMSSRTKRSDESCLDYLLSMKELGKRGKMPDYVAIKYIVEGIQDTPVNKMILYGVTTYVELKEKVKIYETIKEKSRGTHHEARSSRPKQVENYASKKCYNCGENSHLSSECPHKQKGLKCFRCNQFGHISSQCASSSAAGTSRNSTSYSNQHGGSAKQMCVQKERMNETTSNGTNGAANEGESRFTSNECKSNVTANGSRSNETQTSENDRPVHASKMAAMNVNNNGGRQPANYDTKPMKDVLLFNKSVSSLVDSGSDINLLAVECYESLNAPDYIRNEIWLTGLGSTRVKSVGYLTTNIIIDGQCYENVTFHIVPRDAMPFLLILGQEFLKNVTFVMEGSRVFLLKSSDGWLRNIMCGVDVSDVVGFVGDTALQQEVKRLVETYRPNKTREAPIQLRITLKDDIPVAQRPRRLALAEQREVERQVKQWLDDGIIRVSFSEYASPLVLVKKKDGSTRICVDYRQINKKMVKDEYPLPVIEDHIDRLAKARVFSTLDLKNGYFHLTVHEDSIKYTSFVTNNSQYEFLKAPFGLSVCPKVFTRFINAIFRDLIEKEYVLIFIDDVIILAEDEVQAVERLKEVLLRASQYGLEVNWKKSQLVQRRVEYLGHVVENGTVRPSPDKTDAVVRFPQPTNLKQLQSFIGLTSYFRKFIPNYALIARPLTELVKQDVGFVFEAPQKAAFHELKMKLASTPVLRIYDPQLQTEMHTDASMVALAAILLQRYPDDGQLHPVYYMSKKTSVLEQKYTSYELEALAVIEASTNLVGKFTQSVRRIVQDVKDEGASSGQTKEEVIETNERLRGVRIRLDENYDTAKKALVTLMTRYNESKAQRNLFTRYAMLKVMIKDVIRLETQYWSLVEIPRQEKAETVPAFVLRACAIMEKTQKSGEGVKTSSKLAEEAADRRDRIERLSDMTTSQIEAENTQMTNDLYRLLKKYTGLRNLIRELKSEYVSSKVYPMFPRYTMLKDMIKDIMHDPDYMEVCHEVDP